MSLMHSLMKPPRSAVTGGRVLILADGPDAVGTYFPRVDIFSPQMKPQKREGTPWSGYWVTSFSWLRRDGPFARIPGDLFLDQSFERRHS